MTSQNSIDQDNDFHAHKPVQSPREREIELYNGELSGSMKGLRLGKALAQHRLEKEETEKQEKRNHDSVMRHVIQMASQAYDNLMGNIDDFMDRVNNAIEELEHKMRENRRQYDQLTNRMDAIDDVLEGYKNSGEMNRDAAQNILKQAGKNTQGSSDAEFAHLLILTLSEHSVSVDDLGMEWEDQVQDHTELKQVRAQALEIKDRAFEIKQSVAPEDQPAAFDELAREADNLSAVYEARMQTQDASLKEEIGHSLDDIHAAQNTNGNEGGGSVDYSKFTMNF